MMSTLFTYFSLIEKLLLQRFEHNEEMETVYRRCCQCRHLKLICFSSYTIRALTPIFSQLSDSAEPPGLSDELWLWLQYFS